MKTQALAGAVLLLLAAALPAANPARAQLTIDGEEIADAKLFAAAKQEAKLNLYSTYPSENMSSILEAFRKETGLEVDYVRLATSSMYDRVLSEFNAKRLEADYIDLTDLTLIKGWMEAGALAEYKVPWFDKIDPALRDDNGHWYFIVRPIQAIGINTAVLPLDQAPKSWVETLDPKFKGKIGMPAISAGGSAVVIYHLLREKAGPDAWQRLAANEPRIYATAAPVVNDLVRGRTALCYCGAGAVAQEKEKGAPVTVIFPTDGLGAFGAMGNVTSTARHPNAAKLWINFMTSRHGGTLVAKTGAYGTHPASPPPEVGGFKFPAQDQVFNVSIETWSRIADSYPKEWAAVFKQ